VNANERRARDHHGMPGVNRAFAALTLTAALLLAGCHRPADGAAPVSTAVAASTDAHAGLLAPDTTGDASRWINGPPAPLSAARGSVVLVEAWDRYCIPCRQSVPAILALQSRYGARGLHVISVAAFDDAPGERQILADVAREERMTYPCFLDLGSVWQHAAGTSGVIPMVLLVDRQGRFAAQEKGLLLQGAPSFERLAAAIEHALVGS
jgi:thiol-disulfide isomerase/thioredoxin